MMDRTISIVIADGTHVVTVDGQALTNPRLELQIIAGGQVVAPPEEPPTDEPPVEEPPKEPSPVEPPAEEPPVEPPPADAPLLIRKAATMRPGEWRNLEAQTTWPGKPEGRDFKKFQYVGIADGMGWTQPIVYHDGELMMLIFRDKRGTQAFMHMDAEGGWSRTDYPPGFVEYLGGRRPFHRLMQDDTYMYFAPRGGTREKIGYLLRTPLNNPGEFEPVGPAFGDDVIDTVGSFAMIWVEEWRRFYAYTPGFRIWSRAPDDTAWTRHDVPPPYEDGKRLSGYAGMLLWNHIKKEILVVGGQRFGDNPQDSYKGYVIREPIGRPTPLPYRRFPDGTLDEWNHGGQKCLVHPHDGSYLHVTGWNGRRSVLRSVSGGGTMELFQDLEDLRPYGGYEPYVVFAPIPGTDCFAYVSHIRGLGIYRPQSTAGFRVEPEDDPVPLRAGPTTPESEPDHEPEPVEEPSSEHDPDPDTDPDEDSAPKPEPEPHLPVPGDLVGTAIAAAAEECAPGRTKAISGATLPPYIAAWKNFHNFGAQGGVPNDHDTWGGLGFYDRRRQVTLIYNDRTGGAYESYNRATFSGYILQEDRFRHFPLPEARIGMPHVYSKNAYDDSRGHFYRAPSAGTLHRFAIDGEAWEHPVVTPPPTGLGWVAPIAYHEGLDMLVAMDDTPGSRRLWGWRDGDTTWTDIAAMGINCYHGMMIYNRRRGDLLAIDTNSACPCRLVLANGEVVPMPPADFTDRGIAGSNISYDPISGNYLLRSAKKLWELNPEAEEWRLAVDWDAAPFSEDWPGPYYGRPFIVIDPLSVLLWQTYYGPRIYRHRSVF